MKKEINTFPALFILRTWVVGTNHYVPNLDKESKVTLRREPDNPHDENAIAVVNETGEKCGYLPRYDSRYLAPLLQRGAIEIVLEPTGERNFERLSVILHLKLLAKGKTVWDALKSSGLDSVYHQVMVEVWQGVEGLSDDAIAKFRGYFRDIVHENAAAYETQFLYRMLKGVPEQRRIMAEEKKEQERLKREQDQQEQQRELRAALTLALGEIKPCDVIHCGRIMIIPLSCSLPGSKMICGDDAVKSGTLTFERDLTSGFIRVFNHGELPVLCPPEMVINDGFDLCEVIRPCEVPAGGQVDLKLVDQSDYFEGGLVSPHLTVKDAGRGKPGACSTECGEVLLWVDLSQNDEQLARLQGCRGAAVFVDGMFDRIELYPDEDMLLRAWQHERFFSARDGAVISNAQMFKIIDRLIYHARVKEARTVNDSPVRKELDLTLDDTCGTALTSSKHLVYMNFIRP